MCKVAVVATLAYGGVVWVYVALNRYMFFRAEDIFGMLVGGAAVIWAVCLGLPWILAPSRSEPSKQP